jgi:predicted ATPase/class 3 adenylate cyclase
VKDGLPTGTLTFLFTDVEGSTRALTELGGDAYAAALDEHNRVIRAAVAAHNGVEVDTQGDAFFCVFSSAREAVACAETAQEGLARGPVRVRMGLHTGEALVVDGHYVGLDVHRASRVAAAGHGGQVLLSATTAPLLEPGSFELRDLGEHRLKDLSAPVRLFQLGGEAFPPLKTLHRTNLPVPATSFLGRERELEELLALARDRANRLLTLTGPGGTGKTRLALQLAAELADDYAGGVFWTSLAPLRDAAAVRSSIAHELGLDEADLDSAVTVERPTLLLIDNCEHLLDEVAQVLSPLLRTADNLHVLATSREPLALAGERVVPVEPLERRDAVTLFRVRAEAAGASDLDREASAKLCARLDDLPLAIELAAARAPAFPPQLLLERLADRLDLLRGTRDAEDRQRTLAATIGWSYELLSAHEQRAFSNLSVFVGGANIAATEEVAQADVDELGSLVNKSLVRVLPTSSGPRYWMLETIREFANAHVDESTAGPLRGRFVEFFARLAGEAAPKLGDRDAALWLDRLEAEVGNLRLAFTLAADSDPDAAGVLASALANLHLVRGRYEEAHEVLSTAIDLAADPLVLARLNRLLGDLLIRHDEFEPAAKAYAAGLRLLGAPENRSSKWWREWIDLRMHEATLYYWKADSATLHAAANSLSPYVEAHGTPRQRANFIETQVFDLLRRDRYVASEEAETLARAYLDAAKAAGDWDGHFMLGFVLLWRSKFAEATEQFRAAREEAREVGDVLTEIRSLIYRAMARRRLDDVDSVRELDREIAEFEETYGYTGLISANRAWLAWRDGDLDATETWGAAALAEWPLAKRAGPTVFQWTARFPLLAVAVERGRLDSASEQAQAMLDEQQQPLPEDLRATLEQALVTPSPESFGAAVELARGRGIA